MFLFGLNAGKQIPRTKPPLLIASTIMHILQYLMGPQGLRIETIVRITNKDPWQTRNRTIPRKSLVEG